MGSEEARPPEQPQPEAHAGGHDTKAVVAALLANLGIAVAKFVGYLVTGASSMLAEALHSVADSGNQAMLLAGSRLARRGPDSGHPFGHGRGPLLRRVPGRGGVVHPGVAVLAV